MFSNDTLDTVLKELRPYLDREGRATESDFNGYSTLRVSNVLEYSSTSADVIGHDLVMKVADAVLLDYCESYQIGSSAAIEIFPGEKEQILHTDDDMYDMYPLEKLESIEFQISAMVPLCDFAIENGATHVVPGSNYRIPPFEGSRVNEARQNAIQAEMKKGSVLFYMGSTFHGGGANNSDQPRAGLVTTYSLGWLTPEEKLLIMIPREIADSYPEHIRRLIGYQAHSENLGIYPNDPDGYWPVPEQTK